MTRRGGQRDLACLGELIAIGCGDKNCLDDSMTWPAGGESFDKQSCRMGLFMHIINTSLYYINLLWTNGDVNLEQVPCQFVHVLK